MSILDVASKVVVEFKGDVSDLKSKIKDLQGEEKKLAEEQLKQAEARNKQLEGWKDGLGKVALALGVTAAAGVAMWAGMEHNARKAQLTMNAAGLNVERLRKGFGGLRTEMQSLEIASSLANSKFKLTGDQMETVGKAMRQLVREGHDWEDVTKKVTDAFVKLNGSGLDDFGIHVREAKTEGDKFAAVLEAMSAKAGGLTDTTNTAAESITNYQVKFTNAMDRIKEGIGRVADIIAHLVDIIPKGWMESSGGSSRALNMLADASVLKIGRDTEATSRKLLARWGGTDPRGWGYVGLRQDLAYGGIGALRGNRDYNEAHPDKAKGGSASDPYASWETALPWFRQNIALQQRPEFAASDVFGGYGASTGGVSSARLSVLDHEGTEAAYNKFNESKLAAVFGPLEDFDAYKTAFETLNGAVGSAFGAWIDGSASAGEAFKKFIGEALKGVAVQMAMEAIKHGAYAIGSLAFGNFAGAATHAKAAAAFAAGAVTVGVAAKALHSGGSSTGAGASPGGGVPAYSGGGNNQGGGAQTIVVAMGPDFTQDSSRARAIRAAKILDDAKAATGRGAVSYP